MRVEPRDHGRVRSWAASSTEAAERRREANELVGQYIRQVRYFTLDYRRYELNPERIDPGPREIQAPTELQDPTWLCDGFDAIDYGIDLVTDSDVTFSLTWDPPGHHEGIGLQPVPMLGSALRPDAEVAIWTVQEQSAAWGQLIEGAVTGVELHYIPWDEEDGSLWCPRITFRTDHRLVEVIMGDSQDGTLVPSADNVAVLHPGTKMPAWLGVWADLP